MDISWGKMVNNYKDFVEGIMVYEKFIVLLTTLL